MLGLACLPPIRADPVACYAQHCIAAQSACLLSMEVDTHLHAHGTSNFLLYSSTVPHQTTPSKQAHLTQIQAASVRLRTVENENMPSFNRCPCCSKTMTGTPTSSEEHPTISGTASHHHSVPSLYSRLRLSFNIRCFSYSTSTMETHHNRGVGPPSPELA